MFPGGHLAISPSRASDFKLCPQLYKFRAIDRLVEPADPALLRGSVVHLVLERLHRLDGPERTRESAERLLVESWAAMDLELGGALEQADEAKILATARRLLDNYFEVEDPSDIQPLEIEWEVEHQGTRTLLRGVIDRVEATPEGGWILTDYKTGRSPSESYALGSFFGLRFYALVCWRAHGKMPEALRLVHLQEPEVVTLAPTEQMLEGLERQLDALGVAIARAHATGDWRPHPGRICSWCPHRQICPAWAVQHEEEGAAATGA